MGAKSVVSRYPEYLDTRVQVGHLVIFMDLEFVFGHEITTLIISDYYHYFVNF